MADNVIEKKIGRTAFLYILISVVLLAAVSMIQLLGNMDADVSYYLAVFISLGFGVLNVLLSTKYFIKIDRNDFGKGLGLVITILILAILGAAVIYYFLKSNYLFLSYALAFVLPYLIWQVYNYLLRIPPPLYKVWHYPLQEEMPDLDMIDLSQIEVVQFVFIKRNSDQRQTNFTSKAPLNMTLGQLFFIFINDYNERNSQNTIEFMQGPQVPFAWLFYRKKKWFGRRFYFDPDLSFKENAIQPNEFIYASRVM